METNKSSDIARYIKQKVWKHNLEYLQSHDISKKGQVVWKPILRNYLSDVAEYMRTLNLADIQGWKLAESEGWKFADIIFLQGWKCADIILSGVEVSRHSF